MLSGVSELRSAVSAAPKAAGSTGRMSVERLIQNRGDGCISRFSPLLFCHGSLLTRDLLLWEGWLSQDLACTCFHP